MKDVLAKEFLQYGQMLQGFDFNGFIEEHKEELLEKIPSEGNIYETSNLELEKSSLFTWLKENIYGGMMIQLGVCAGQNMETSAVEYHMGSEVVIAGTDCLLPLGHKTDFVDNRYDVAQMETFLLKKGQAVELYSTTLHYSPLKSENQGYATIVALLAGTNMPLLCKSDNPLLLAQNKFMIVHSSRKDKIADGALPSLKNQRI